MSVESDGRFDHTSVARRARGIADARFISSVIFAVATAACSSHPAATPDVANDTIDAATDPIDAAADTSTTDSSSDAVTDDSAHDAASAGLLQFAVFGDVRPPSFNDTAHYPTMIIDSVIAGFQGLGAQFAVATGDYMFAYDTSDTEANAQLDLLLASEHRFAGSVFHAMGNHECTTASTSNCPLGNESAPVRAFRARLIPDRPALYYDFTVATPLGDARFVMTAPNAWSDAQSAWLTAVLARRDARYTFVVAHEPPTSTTIPPGTMPIEAAIDANPGTVTVRLYGHVHYYRHTGPNAVVVGNSGAPLSGTSVGAVYGFTMLSQRADGDIVITAYQIGSPPMVMESFVLHPDGSPSM